VSLRRTLRGGVASQASCSRVKAAPEGNRQAERSIQLACAWEARAHQSCSRTVRSSRYIVLLRKSMPIVAWFEQGRGREPGSFHAALQMRAW
jgi:hypothetical protein